MRRLRKRVLVLSTLAKGRPSLGGGVCVSSRRVPLQSPDRFADLAARLPEGDDLVDRQLAIPGRRRPADAPEAGPGWIAHWHENRLGEAGAAGPGPISGFGFGPPTITTTVPTFSAVTSRKFGGSTRGGRAFALVPRRRGINQRFMLSLCPNHF
jgi:hypothetical protein